jgi:hypothetical protein
MVVAGSSSASTLTLSADCPHFRFLLVATTLVSSISLSKICTHVVDNTTAANNFIREWWATSTRALLQPALLSLTAVTSTKPHQLRRPTNAFITLHVHTRPRLVLCWSREVPTSPSSSLTGILLGSPPLSALTLIVELQHWRRRPASRPPCAIRK